jgi:hypothetical protein
MLYDVITQKDLPTTASVRKSLEDKIGKDAKLVSWQLFDRMTSEKEYMIAVEYENPWEERK